MSKTILLVDDEPPVLRALQRLLQRAGYRVFTAENGAMALALLASQQVALVVSDFRMPGMNGAQLVHEFKSVQPGLRALIVSGYAEEDGIDIEIPRLTKPFRSAELAASLSALSNEAAA